MRDRKKDGRQDHHTVVYEARKERIQLGKEGKKTVGQGRERTPSGKEGKKTVVSQNKKER